MVREPSKIARQVERIAKSGQSVADYFRTHPVPFSRPQYFRYKARLAARGLDGLRDRRREGHHRKFTAAAQGYVRAVRESHPRWGLGQIGAALKNALGIQVDASTLSRYLRGVGAAVQWPRAAQPERHPTACAGFELIAALALHLGWAQHTAQVLQQGCRRFARTAAYRHQRVTRDHRGRNERGQFTAAYNARPEVRAQRFASVADKRAHKNYSRMAVFQAGPRVLGRKCLAVLALPLITLNGTTRSVNGPLGNDLAAFCGFNYQQGTLDKFLRELKYLGLSDRLLRDAVAFWTQQWPPRPGAGRPLLCYYVDGNTKPLWSEQRVQQSKVSMLGRVMGCLEQVFVHDGRGHPLYVETFAGKAPMGEHVLRLMEELEAALASPGAAPKIQRVIVMDAASNGVGTLRAFAQQEHYHYITALDDNQWHPERVRVEGRAQRYAHGAATLRDCELELEDSRERGYLVVVRAVRIDWDHGKRTVLITSLPAAAVGASLVVKAYFDRWPCEELSFRGMKSFACLNRVAGYGKKRLPDARVRQAQAQLLARIAAWRQRLREPLQALDQVEARLAATVTRERRLRRRTQIVAGRRVADPATQEQLRALARQRAQGRRQLNALAAQYGKDLRRLRRAEKRWLRLQGKDHVYRIDVELDQLLAYFRVALVNLSSWFLSEGLGKGAMSFTQLLHTILLLPGEVQQTPERRRVVLQRNPKDPATMALLEPALQKFNGFAIHDLDGRRMEFMLR